MVCLLVVFGLLLLPAASVSAAAQEPQAASSSTRVVPYTGVLHDSSGAAIAGVHAITFTILDEREAGTPLWSETQTVATDAQGRYLVYLGAGQTLPIDIFRTEQARWLEVSIDGRNLPRVMLVSAPYALHAADAETLGGRAVSDFVVAGADGKLQLADGTALDRPAVSGSGIVTALAKWSDATTLSASGVNETSDGRVGIGVADPTEGGRLDSKITIRASEGTTALAVSNPVGMPRFALNTNFDGSWTTYDHAAGFFQPGISQKGGRVGVSTTDPTGGGVVDSKFSVRNFDNNTGISVLNEVDARRFALNTYNDGSWRMFDGAGDTWSEGLRQKGGSIAVGPPRPFFPFTAKIEAIQGDVNRPAGYFAIITAPSTADALTGATTGSGRGVSGGSATGVGVFGSSTSGLAALFSGNVTVSGALTKGGGAFEIDHPLDPANKYLSHSFVESPDMMNVYNGNVLLDANGEAWIRLPEWFQALNRDFRYQLTAIGAPGPNLYVASEIADNQFKIAGGTASGKVSWQITGIRQDAWANAHRIPVERDKPAAERGFYLHPDVFEMPDSLAMPSLRVTPLSPRAPR